MKRILFSLALLFPLCLQAQTHHEIGLSFGVANYFGDLQNKWAPSYGYKPVGGLVYKYFMSPHVGLRFGINYTAVTAADSLSDIPSNKARNLSFATNILEGYAGLELNLLPIDVDRMKVTPYVFGGIAVFYFNPYAIDPNGNKTYLKPLSTEGEDLAAYPDRKGYKLVQTSFPFGGGVKFLIGNTFLIAPEIGLRYTNTDYLDDVSKSYVNLDTLANAKGKIASLMAFRGDEVQGFKEKGSVYPNYKYQRGDSKTNDWYWFATINITIYLRTFGNVRDYLQGRCPSFWR